MEEILILITLLLSAFFSGAETAFVSVNRFRIEIWASQKKRGADEALKFIKNPESFLMTTLVGTNIMNTICATLAAVYLSFYVERIWIPFITAACILVFGEVVPKAVFRENANLLTLKTALVLRWSERILKFFYFIQIANFLSSLILNILKVTRKEDESFLSKKDMELLLHEGVKKGFIEVQEHKMIKRLFDFGHRSVRELMIPRINIKAIEKNESIESLTELLIKTGYSRFPVYDKNLDNIVGFVVIFDLFKKPIAIKEIIRKVLFVPDTKSAFNLLQTMRKQKKPMAVVLDEFGGTAGLITIEDLIEELFGDIQDEYDTYSNWLWKLSNDSWIIEGWAEIDTINEVEDLFIESGNYTTLAGWIIGKLERIPEKEEEITIDRYKVKILNTDGKTVKRAMLHRTKDGDTNNR